MIQNFWAQSPYRDQLHLHITDAKTFIEKESGPWDLVFMDAAKKEYPLYFDLLQDKVPSGGLIIADNVLWSGKVADPNAKDASTEALRVYAQKVQDHPDWENVMVPLRDGLLMARKR
jgi:predicted O-methyltransferase YrrM